MIKQILITLCILVFCANASEHHINEKEIRNVSIKDDEYHISSNLWGAANKEANIENFQFNMSLPDKDSIPAFEFNWNIEHKLPQPIYPFIGYGTRMWKAQMRSTTKKLPIKIEDIAHCDLHHAIDIDAVNFRKGKGNLAYDVWFGKNNIANSHDQRIEMMLWLDVNQQMPIGANNLLGTYNIDGLTWNLYLGYLKPKGVINGVTVCSFIAQQPFYQGKIDMMKFVKILKQKKALKDEYYLGGIELGSEIYKGKGATSIKSFFVDLRRRGLSSQGLVKEWRFNELNFGKKIFNPKNKTTEAVNFSSKERTIAIRFKATKNSTRQVIYQEGNKNHKLSISVLENKITCEFTAKGTQAKKLYTTLPSEKKSSYHNIVFVLNGDKAQAFLNGQSIGEVQIPSLKKEMGKCSIGFSYDKKALPFKGVIDDILIYNRVLDEKEITLFR